MSAGQADGGGPPDAAGQRLDVWLAAALGLSRARVKELLEAGAVRQGGRRIRKGDRTVAGARLEVELPADDPRPVPEPEAPLSVLHADEALVAVDKPAGRPSHPLLPGERGTVVNALVARYPELPDASAGSAGGRAGPPAGHRDLGRPARRAHPAGVGGGARGLRPAARWTSATWRW